MAIERLSRATIKRAEVHDWNHLGAKLAEDSWVRALLGTQLQGWVTNVGLPNPLAIRWVYLVWNKPVHYIRNELESWLGQPDSRVLAVMLGELGQYSCSADAEQKIESLACEAAVYRLLKNRWPRIERLASGGDWGVEQRRVSVKSVLPLELTYRTVEHALRAWQATAENLHARRIGRLRLSRLDAVNYRSLPRILSLIDAELDGILDQWLERDARSGEKTGSYRFVQTRENELYVSLQDPCDHSRVIAELEISTRDGDDNLVSISYDKNAWFYEPIGQTWLGQRFRENLERVERETTGAGHTVEAWVNLLVHPRNEDWILDNLATIRCVFQDVARDFDFPSSVCLHPEWTFRMGTPKFWSFNGGVAGDLCSAIA